MASVRYGSFMASEPATGVPGGTVRVTWRVSDQTAPGPGDEVRLVTSAGALVARAFLDVEARLPAVPQEDGAVDIVCPPHPGGYLLALYDCTSYKRVLSVPFRVVGPTLTLATVSLLHGVGVGRPVAPDTNVPVSFRWSELPDVGAAVHQAVVTVTTTDAPDNDGFLGTNGYTHVRSAFTVRRGDVDEASVTVVAPDREGTYEVRVLVRPSCVVPCAVGRSVPFAVEAGAEALPSRRGAFIEPAATKCAPGSFLDVAWSLRGEAAVPSTMSPLDHVRFFPLGRSEQDIFDGRLTACVGNIILDGGMCVRAPVREGLYDVALRRFQDNESVVLSAAPVHVTMPAGTMDVRPADAFRDTSDYIVSITTDAAGMLSTEDRVLAYDETANILASAFVDVTAATAADAVLHLHSAGKFNIKYYSARLGQVMPWRPSELLTVPLASVRRIPAAVINALHTVPVDAPRVEVVFEKSEAPPDWRDLEVQRRDVLALFAIDAPECVTTQWADDPNAMPALEVCPLRGASEAELTFSMPPQCGRYTLRYMAATGVANQRLCVSEAHFVVVDVPLATRTLEQALQVDLTRTRHRQQQDPPVRGGSTRTSSIASSTRPLQFGRRRQTSVTAPLPAAVREEPGDVVQSFLGARRSSTMFQPSVARGGYRRAVRMIVGEVPSFSGAVLGPTTCSTADEVRTTFHVVEGDVCLEDLVLLLNDDCSAVVSEVTVGLCALRPGMAKLLGEAVLNPPRNPGKFFAAYYSQRHCGVVLLSERIRIKGTTAPRVAEADAVVASGDSDGTVPALGCDASALLRPLPGRPAGPRLRVLLCGCAYRKSPVELTGPQNDLRLLAPLLVRQCRVEPENLLLLHEWQTDRALVPTAAAIRLGLEWLTHDARRGDQLLFYFSGCGSRTDAGVGNVAGGTSSSPGATCSGRQTIDSDCALLPMDYDFEHRAVTYSELRRRFFEAPSVPTDADAVAIIDACFTSTALDVAEQEFRRHNAPPPGVVLLNRLRESEGVPLRSRFRALAPPIPGRLCAAPAMAEEAVGVPHGLTPLLFAAGSSDAAGKVALSRRRLALLEACRSTSAFPNGAWDDFVRSRGCTMGLMTHALVQVLSAEAARPSGITAGLRWAELAEAVARLLRAEACGRSQLPQLSVSHHGMLDRPVFPLAPSQADV